MVTPEVPGGLRSAFSMLLPNQLINQGAQLRCGISDIEPECFGSFEIEDEFELGRLLDRQIAWLLTLEDAACVLPHELVAPGQLAAIAHQSARFDIFAPRIHCRYRIAGRQLHNPMPLAGEERSGGDQERAHLLLSSRFESRIDFGCRV